MARYRLRFLLQEFDLGGVEVTLGRSPECHISIEDPLVSRQHARIDLRVEPPILHDLGSRNGVRLNGEKIVSQRPLQDGDRIRLGTQELVFYVVEASRKKRVAKTTGFMAMCGSCSTPYPEQSPQCPHCGAWPREEETISGLAVEPKRSWTFQLLGEVIEKALESNRGADADRIMRRVASEVDERLAAGESLDPEHVDLLASFALRLCRLSEGADWVRWALGVHQRQGLFVSPGFVQGLETGPTSPAVRAEVGTFATWAMANPEALRTPPTDAAIVRLKRVASGAGVS